MAAKRSRQTRENVTEIKPVAPEAANESRAENRPQDGFARADNSGQPELEHQAAADAAEEILGANPLLGLDREELLAAGKRLLRLMTVNPQVLIEENLRFARELVEIAMGRSRVLPDARDRRFSHNVWQQSGYYKRLMQGFVAWLRNTTAVTSHSRHRWVRSQHRTKWDTGLPPPLELRWPPSSLLQPPQHP